MIVLITGLIAGSLDLGAALLLFISQSRQNPSLLLRYIASAVFGPRAFGNGFGMAFVGLCFHYLIALCWTGLYFAFFPRVFPCDTAVLTNAVVYGLFVWVIMNLVVLPLSQAAQRPFSALMALVNMFILIITIGLPCAYVANHYSLYRFGF